MVLSRRFLLGGGLLGGLAWATGTAARHLGPGSIPESGLPESLALGGRAQMALIAALEVFLPDPAEAEDIAAGVDRFLASGAPEPVADLRLALLLLEHGGPGVLGFSTFSALSMDERTAVLAAWERSPLGPKRQIFHALRRLAAFALYTRPSRWAAIGYDGPWEGR